MHAHAHLALHHVHAAELHADAQKYRLARSARGSRPLRTALGQALIEVGLRLTAPSRPTVALT
ncbi:hypothetical protein ACFZAT_10470 [Streptomyces sp. NPDC008163]|uniref:hypothetical protein n=1 Tax=Streptomyces sp. NPDC008163 TaxID=3364818 RepID=UPI0036E16BCD